MLWILDLNDSRWILLIVDLNDSGWIMNSEQHTQSSVERADSTNRALCQPVSLSYRWSYCMYGRMNRMYVCVYVCMVVCIIIGRIVCMVVLYVWLYACKMKLI